MERIALARKYRVAEWLRNAYFELTENKTLDIEELRPAEPFSNSLDKTWEATSRDWETLARIFYLQTKVAAAFEAGVSHSCPSCDVPEYFGRIPSSLCKCGILAMVDEAFRRELESLKENSEPFEPPLPCKLPT